MANTLRVKRGLAGTLPNGAQGEPLFTTDTYELYIGKGDGTNQRYQKYIASGTTSQYLRGDGSLETHNLDSLTDVIVSTPSNGQVLQYNGTNWVNSTSGFITGSATAPGQVGVFSSVSNIAGYTTFTFDTVTDKLSMTNGYVNNTLTVDGQLVIKSESGASAYTRGLKFPDNSYGGAGDIAGLRLHNAGGENIILELYAGNDSLDTINFAVAAGGSTYNDNVTINGNKIWNAGNLPSPLSSTGSITSGEIAIFSNSTTVYSDTALFWDNSLNRLGIGGNSPNAQVGVSTSSGVNAFGYKTSGASYYEMVLVYDNTTYGHLFQTGRGASTSARNITFLNASSTVSIDESGNMGIGLIVPNPGTSGPGGLGLDIYASTTAALALHNATSGTGISAGGRIYYNSTNMTIRNLSAGNISMTVDNGNFVVITNGAENVKVEGSTGKVGIGNPASIAEMLTVNGSIQQSAVTSSMLKANASGKIIAAVSNTDFQAPITLTTNNTSGAATFNGTTLNIPQYQAAGNYITGAGNSGYLPKYTGSYTIANSLVYDNGSRVMINTTTDNTVEMLQVNGGIRGTSLRVASNFSSGTAVNVLGQIYVDNRSSQGGNRIFLTPNTTSTTPYVHFYEPFTAFNTNGGISIGTSNAITTTPTDSIMHWDANNLRVGIGTTAPQNPLHIQSNTLSQLNVTALSGNTNAQINLEPTGTGIALIGPANGVDLSFRTNAAIRLTLNGSTGAATFSSSVTANTTVQVTSADTLGTNVNIINTSTGGYNWNIFSGGSAATLAPVGSLIFRDSTNGITRMVISTGGNVGIGTANPQSITNGLSLTIGDSATQHQPYLAFRRNSTGGYWAGINWYDGTTRKSFIEENANFDLRFGTSNALAMTITSGGNVLINGSSASSIATIYPASGSADTLTWRTIGNTSAGALHAYSDANGPASGIGHNFSQTSGGGANRFNGSFSAWGISFDSRPASDQMTFNYINTSGTYSTHMRITSGGNVGIGTTGSSTVRLFTAGSGTSSAASAFIAGDVGGNTLFQVRNDGNIGTGLQIASPYNNTSSSASNLIVFTDGTLGRSTSSLKYKTDVTDYNNGLSKVMQLRPVSYKGKNDGDKMFAGLIAEEVHDLGLTEFVQYAEDGSPDALAYQNMVALLTKAIQEQQAQIEELKAKLN